MPTFSRNLMNTKMLAMLVLGFSSGLPLALTGSTLQAWFTKSGVNLMAIGMLSLLGLPYILKFLWAPLMDQFHFPGGRHRGWILFTQFGLFLMLFILANMNPNQHATLIGLLAITIAFLSASQDVAIDAYRTDMLEPQERGIGVAYYTFAYRMAMLVSGGLAWVLADTFGWRMTYQTMAVLLLFAMVMTYRAPAAPVVTLPRQSLWCTISQAFYYLLSQEKIALLLLFVALYKFGDALSAALLSNFLLHELGFSLTEIGLAYKIISIVATIMGAFVGGVILTRMSLYTALLWFGLAQAFAILTLVALAMLGKNFIFMFITLFVDSFCSGMGTTAFLAFLMSLCDKRYTATHFAFLSAIASLGRVFLGPAAALLVEQVGWVQFYLWSFFLSFPGLLVLMLLKTRVNDYATAVE